MIRLMILFLFLTGQAKALETIRLEPGESQVIALPAESGLRVSQKNILEIESLPKGRYRLLAMRSGLVHLKAESEDGTIRQSWLVEVLPRDPDHQWLRKDKWRLFFCDQPNVHCDEEAGLVSGQTDDLAWLHGARTQCSKRPACRFTVRLSELGIETWTERLRHYAPGLDLTIRDDGQVLAKRDCGKDPIYESLQKTLDESYGIPLQSVCAVKRPETWSLDVVTVAHRKRQSQASNPLHWKILELPPEENISAVIDGLSTSSDIHILAQPALLMSPGSSILLADGMEIQTVAVQRDSDELLWKPVGFQLDLKFLAIDEDQARFQLSLRLSRAQEGLRSVEASRMQTELWIGIDRFVQVGKMEASLSGNEESRIPWLSAIPLLGRLFTWTEESEGKSEVELYLRLRRADDLRNPAEMNRKADSDGTE